MSTALNITNTMFRFIMFSLILFSPIVFASNIDEYSHYKFHDVKYVVNQDSSYQVEEQFQVKLQSDNAIKRWREFSISYYSKTDYLTVIDAFVIDESGHKHHITKQDMVVSRQDNNGDQQVSTITIYLPRLGIGSEFYLHYVREHKEASIFGFNAIVTADTSMYTKQSQVIFDFPKSLNLSWHVEKPYQVTKQETKDRDVITAKSGVLKPIYAESNMISTQDLVPTITVSNFKNYEEMGNLYWHHVEGKIIVNDEIKKLASQIVGKKRGLEAIHALNEWVSGAIQYHSLTFDLKSHFIPHTSIETLHRRYGDCKDKVILLIALSKAVGIKAEPVLVDWSNAYKVYAKPQPGQFNHLMIYFPDYKVYSNPTDENTIPGLLDIHLSNKMVLLAGPQSKVAYTPKGHPRNNRYSLHSKVRYDHNGVLHGHSTAKIKGGFYMDMLEIMGNYVSGDEFARNYLNYTPEGGYGHVKVLPEEKADEKRFHLDANWQSDNAITIDDVIVLPVAQGVDMRNPVFLRDAVLDEKISYPMLMRAQTDYWQYEIELPKTYKVMHLPKNIEFKNEEGTYHSQYTLKGHKVLVTRQLILNNDCHTPKQYPQLKQLVNLVLQDFRNGIVLVKS